MVKYDCLVVIHNTREEWKCAAFGLNGALSVTDTGLRLILELCAVLWAMARKVEKNI